MKWRRGGAQILEISRAPREREGEGERYILEIFHLFVSAVGDTAIFTEFAFYTLREEEKGSGRAKKVHRGSFKAMCLPSSSSDIDSPSSHKGKSHGWRHSVNRPIPQGNSNQGHAAQEEEEEELVGMEEE